MVGWRELVIILVIVLLVFGTKRLKNIGSDLGGAVRGFREGMNPDGEKKSEPGKPEANLHDESRKD